MTDVRQLFSNKVTEYVASRPDYPAALLDDLAQLRAERIADLGAGTGIFTKLMLDRGWNVVAVEPNDAMRAAADATLRGYPRYQSVAGSAEATTLPDDSVDLVTAAQAFHWFDIERTREECLRILRPQGQVALVWNDRLLSDPLQLAVEPILNSFGGPRREAVLAREDGVSVCQFFGEGATQKWSYPHEHRLDQGGLINLVLSRSYMPPRDSADGKRAIESISRVFKNHEIAGFVTVRYQTVATLGRPA